MKRLDTSFRRYDDSPNFSRNSKLSNSDAALYLDFEGDRLTGFTAADFQTVQDAFLEPRPEAAGRIVYLFDEIQHVDAEGIKISVLPVWRWVLIR